MLVTSVCMNSKKYLESIARRSISPVMEWLSQHMMVIFAFVTYLSGATKLLSSSNLSMSAFGCYYKAIFICQSNGSFELHIFQSQVDVTELLVVAAQLGPSML